APATFVENNSFVPGAAVRITIFKLAFCSEGTIENNPAFQCRDRLERMSRPAGTTENKRLCQPSLRDSFAITRFPGVQTPGYFQNVPSGRSVFGGAIIEQMFQRPAFHLVPDPALLLQPEQTVAGPRMRMRERRFVLQPHAVSALLVNVQIERHMVFSQRLGEH